MPTGISVYRTVIQYIGPQGASIPVRARPARSAPVQFAISNSVEVDENVFYAISERAGSV